LRRVGRAHDQRLRMELQSHTAHGYGPRHHQARHDLRRLQSRSISQRARARSRREVRRHCGLTSRSQREDRSSSSSSDARVSSRRLQNDGGSGNGNIGWPLKIPTSGSPSCGDGGSAGAPVSNTEACGWPAIRRLKIRTGLPLAIVVSSAGRSGAIGPDDTGPVGKAPGAGAIRLGSIMYVPSTPPVPILFGGDDSIPHDAPCAGAEAEAEPSGAADPLYFSSARKTGDRVLPKRPAGAVPQFPKRLSNDSGRSGATGGAVLAGAEPQFPKRPSNAPELSSDPPDRRRSNPAQSPQRQ